MNPYVKPDTVCSSHSIYFHCSGHDYSEPGIPQYIASLANVPKHFIFLRVCALSVYLLTSLILLTKLIHFASKTYWLLEILDSVLEEWWWLLLKVIMKFLASDKPWKNKFEFVDFINNYQVVKFCEQLPEFVPCIN